MIALFTLSQIVLAYVGTLASIYGCRDINYTVPHNYSSCMHTCVVKLAATEIVFGHLKGLKGIATAFKTVFPPLL